MASQKTMTCRCKRKISLDSIPRTGSSIKCGCGRAISRVPGTDQVQIKDKEPRDGRTR